MIICDAISVRLESANPEFSAPRSSSHGHAQSALKSDS